ncbi:MAG: sugar ABC transporter substrate-binding protein [Pseudomonadota bacterium]|nr:sugar ABC transporter substrate-binding protein [Pseudomonadota bacterium]
MTASAMAQTVGVSMAWFDDYFLTNVREAMAAQALELGAEVLFEDARGDQDRQLAQVRDFIDQGVEAVIVNPVDTAKTAPMTQLATAAGVPLVYVNRRPDEPALPEGVVYVGSDENASGKLQAEEIARLLNNKGNVAIMMGELVTNAALLRTQGVEKVMAGHPQIRIVAKETANFRRNEGFDLMKRWLDAGIRIDAIAANNDEMAIGAITALQQAGRDPRELIIGGIDATPDALAEMEKGNLDVTVFQDAQGQGRGAVYVAVKLAQGGRVDSFLWIPFQLVTKDNYREFLDKWKWL